MCMHACVHLLTKKLQKLLPGLLSNFIVLFLRYRLKSSLHRYRKIRPVEQYRRSSASSFPFIMVQSEMNVQTFRLVQGRLLLFGRLLKSVRVTSFGTCLISWQKCIIDQNFCKLDLWMQISYIVLFMIDLYKDNHVLACVHL